MANLSEQVRYYWKPTEGLIKQIWEGSNTKGHVVKTLIPVCRKCLLGYCAGAEQQQISFPRTFFQIPDF